MRESVRELNDAFRKTFIGGRVMMTDGIASLPPGVQAEILKQVRTFSTFTKDNDPYGEHNFGSFAIRDRKIFWKIDCFDTNCQHGSEDPADPRKTTRVLTIMLADEY